MKAFAGIIALVLATSPLSANMLTNGDFEAEGPQGRNAPVNAGWVAGPDSAVPPSYNGTAFAPRGPAAGSRACRPCPCSPCAGKRLVRR